MRKELAWLDADYIDFTPLLGYGAPYNFLNTTRRRGKTWSIMKRAYGHYKRHHRGTILVRRTEEATRKAKQGAYTKKFCKAFGIDPDTIRIKGDFAQVHDRGRWTNFLQFVTLSQASEERSNDDDFYDLMILDEGMVSARKRAAYHGDEVVDLMDLYDSKRRESRMQLLIIGNRESVGSPYMNFFGIPPLPIDFNGVRRYLDGTVVVAQSTRECREVDEFDRKVKRALSGTRYGMSAYHGVPKDTDTGHIRRRSRKSVYWCSFDFGTPLTAWRDGSTVFFTLGVDRTRTVVVDRLTGVYPNAMVYGIRDRSRFSLLINAKRDNSIYFDNPSVAEAANELLDALRV